MLRVTSLYKSNLIFKPLFMDFKKTNPAVLKSIFLQMDKQTFVLNANALKTELLGQKITLKNANYIFALKNLFYWCRSVYTQKFINS